MKIYTRGSKIWVTLYQDGKRIRKPTGLTDTKANRKQVERELFPILENTDFSEKQTVGYYFVKMIKAKTLKDRSIEVYQDRYNKHISKYENYLIEDIDVKFAREWVASINVGASTLRGIVSVFRQIMSEAIYDCVVSDNPFNNVRLPKIEKYEPELFSNEEANILINNAKGWFKNFLGFSLLTGMRIGEVCALKWSDLQDGFISITKSKYNNIVGTTKTGKDRQIPIFNNLLPYIESQKAISGGSDFIFPKAHGAQHLRRRWLVVCKKSNLQGRILYNTRHTFATKALRSGKFNVFQVSKLLGHSSTQMLFQKYAKDIKSEKAEYDLNFSTF